MTELTLEAPGRHLFIRACTDHGIRVGDTWFTRSVVISHDTVLDHWPPQAMAELTPGHIEQVLDLEPELVLLGSGARQEFLEPARLAGFYRRHIGIEVMTTEAACRTFNVLVAEGRQVVAALLPASA